MLTYISCAKTMIEKASFAEVSTTLPVFQAQAEAHAMELAGINRETLGAMLRVNEKIAAENALRYGAFFTETPPALPALFSYTGMVFKRINAKDFSIEELLYAQEHLFITSFLYGLLRPLDLIKTYRLEGDVRLEQHNGKTMFQYWQDVLTDFFIAEIKKKGGVLINLASAEMKHLFDWNRVQREVRVITPEFITYKNGKAATIVVYAKMCRGEMTRYILKNRIETVEELRNFSWEGFTYNVDSATDAPIFELYT
ncbi:MAG: YaaA family protein [Phocaeicola sp.]|nr:YaaA family protein [Phocaeicola sp.]MDD7448404.1 YaaA family protein [Prevotellaceae bacterium]MDY3913700.1 YaaA family protein [Phocaeicola sp.]MDY5938346.1 YaaA family protein [Phocaeicola sp.]